MNRFNLICKSITAFLAGVSIVDAAQDPNNLRAPTTAQEYIQSVSPLAGGGAVMSRTTDRGTQTITTIANLPDAGRTNPDIGYQPRIYTGQWTGGTGSGAGGSGGVTPAQTTYVYPTSTPSTVGFRARPTNTLGMEPIGNPRFQQTSAYQAGYQPRYAQNCEACGSGVVNPNSIPNFSPVQTNPTSATTVGTPPAVFGEPVMSAPAPQWPPLPQSNPTQQSWTNPGMQYDFNAPWNQPNATPTRSNYTPLFSLRNLPPGTYIGQGVLGQPKAYIDGEPIRNLLRYMSY